MQFAERAKALKEKGNFTLQELAIVANVAESTMSRYINGVIEPPPDLAVKVLAHMGYQNDIEEIERRVVTESEETSMRIALETMDRLYTARIKDFTDRILELTNHLNYERYQKKVFLIIMLCAVSFIILFMAVDILNGNVGWFRH